MVKPLYEKKMEALASFLSLKYNEITPQENSNDRRYEAEGDEYLVLTYSEAKIAARVAILESVWAFNYSFLARRSKVVAAIPEDDFKAMQHKLCEGLNEAILAMIANKTTFVRDAILADGRGHFLSSYDGEENCENGFYIYRQ